MARTAGVQNKRTVDGQKYARDILEQTAADLEAEDPNPVKERLKVQAREGVGTGVGQLPAPVFVHLCDRAYGKVVDRTKITVTSRHKGASVEELEERASKVAEALRAAREKQSDEESEKGSD